LAQNLRSFEIRQADRGAQEKTAHRRKVARVAGVGAAIFAALICMGGYVFRERGQEQGGTANPQAASKYDHGKAALLINSETSLTNAVTCFEEAIHFDTNYALAYVGLADACRRLCLHYDSREGWDKRGLEAINKAIELKKDLPDAYVVRGTFFFTPFQKWNAARDVDDQKHALRLNSKARNAHSNLAFVYAHLGLHAEERDELDEEDALHPRERSQNWGAAGKYVNQGKDPQALEALKQSSDEDYPHPRVAGYLKAITLLNAGTTNDAASLLEHYLTKKELTDDALLTSVQAIICAAEGKTAESERKIQVAMRGDEGFITFHHVAYDIGTAYALLHRNGEAMKWLKRASEEGMVCYPDLDKDPFLKCLSGDQAFEAWRTNEKKRYEDFKATFGGSSSPSMHK
jgi:hypothetical protein